MNLVLCNMSNVLDWHDGIVNRNFFVARELAKSGLFEQIMLVDFLAINPVGTIFGRRRTAKYVARTWFGGASGAVVKRYGLRHVLCKNPALPWTAAPNTQLYTFSGLGLASHEREDQAKLAQALIDLGCTEQNTLVWSYNAFAPQLLNLTSHFRVFDAVDDWSQHASYRLFTKLLQESYQKIGARADSIFTVSDGLRDLFPTGKASWIPNGVDVGAFKKAAAIPADVSQLRRPLIGYVGTLQERIDFDLLTTVCSALPQADFVFIGPVWSGVQADVDALHHACPNTHFLGRRPYDQVPNYVAALDVAIIPHRLDAFIKSTNPMKLYEYLAAGKPIVTTPGAGTEVFADVIHIVNDADLFTAAIDKAVLENTADFIKKRQLAVQSHTWEARVKQMREQLKHAMVST